MTACKCNEVYQGCLSPAGGTHYLDAEMAASSIHTEVRDYYGTKLKQSADLKTTACAAAKSPHPLIRKLLSEVPDKIATQFYGCGAPVPLGITGLRVRLLPSFGKSPPKGLQATPCLNKYMQQVLDLGCGAGRDCYLASALVGEQGSVIGVDMTRNLVEVVPTSALTLTLVYVFGKAWPDSGDAGGWSACARVHHFAGLLKTQHGLC